MAWGKPKLSKADKIAIEAQQVRDSGATVYTPKLTTAVAEWGVLIAAIEQAGWKLEHWAVWNMGGVVEANAYPVFRATK